MAFGPLPNRLGEEVKFSSCMNRQSQYVTPCFLGCPSPYLFSLCHICGNAREISIRTTSTGTLTATALDENQGLNRFSSLRRVLLSPRLPRTSVVIIRKALISRMNYSWILLLRGAAGDHHDEFLPKMRLPQSHRRHHSFRPSRRSREHRSHLGRAYPGKCLRSSVGETFRNRLLRVKDTVDCTDTRSLAPVRDAHTALKIVGS